MKKKKYHHLVVPCWKIAHCSEFLEQKYPIKSQPSHLQYNAPDLRLAPRSAFAFALLGRTVPVHPGQCRHGAGVCAAEKA